MSVAYFARVDFLNALTGVKAFMLVAFVAVTLFSLMSVLHAC